MTIKRVLVVDDSRSARKVLERMLQKLDIIVSAQEDAESAINHLKDNMPELIFMDHMMPGMDGLEACKAILQQDQWQHLPIVMYTSKDDTDYLQQAKDHGAISVLSKPANVETLKSVIEQVEQQMEGSANDETQLELSSDEPILRQDEIEKIIQEHIAKAIRSSRSDFTASIESALQQAAAATQDNISLMVEQIEENIDLKLNKQIQSPQSTFKSVQPWVQKLSIQIAQKVFLQLSKKSSDISDEKVAVCEKKIDALQASNTALEKRTSQYTRLTQISLSIAIISIITSVMLQLI